MLGQGFSSVWHVIPASFGGLKDNKINQTTLNPWAFGLDRDDGEEGNEWKTLMSHRRED